jgi:hypothetical protein
MNDVIWLLAGYAPAKNDFLFERVYVSQPIQTCMCNNARNKVNEFPVLLEVFLFWFLHCKLELGRYKLSPYIDADKHLKIVV